MEQWFHQLSYWVAAHVPGFESFSNPWEHMLFASHFFFHWSLTTFWILLAVLTKQRRLAWGAFLMLAPVLIAELSNGRFEDWLSRGGGWALGSVVALVYLRCRVDE